MGPGPARAQSPYHRTDLMTTYTTRDGDILDAVCRAFYGREAGAVEAVL